MGLRQDLARRNLRQGPNGRRVRHHGAGHSNISSLRAVRFEPVPARAGRVADIV